jgi:hypothetical protein
MILEDSYGDKYLEDYRLGNIKLGLGLGCDAIDDYVRFKKGQFIIINGLDNIGKTSGLLWYLLCLSVLHGLKWDIWSGEDKPEKQKRELIEMYMGKKLNRMNPAEFARGKEMINKWFNFINIKKSYTHTDLFKIFKDTPSAGALVDPYTGLKRGFGHGDNYGFLNETREFVNSSDKTLFVNTHPNSDAARRNYPKEHDLAGYSMPPGKAEVEGGQPFASRADDFWTYHRLPNHKDYWSKTHWHVRKVKDTDSGGKQTFFDDPIELEYNGGLGFLIRDGAKWFNPLKNNREIQMSAPLTPNTNFEDNTPTINF